MSLSMMWTPTIFNFLLIAPLCYAFLPASPAHAAQPPLMIALLLFLLQRKTFIEIVQHFSEFFRIF
jgi:hypothetical protein